MGGRPGVVLGEGHVRPGGDFIHLLVSSVHGANIFDPLIADALRQHGRKTLLTMDLSFLNGAMVTVALFAISKSLPELSQP